jgi:hypothetical protein
VSDSWAVAGAKAALLLALSIVGFVLVPDRLLVFLSTRVAPHVRDLFVVAWVVVAFAVLAVLFTRVQRWQM